MSTSDIHTNGAAAQAHPTTTTPTTSNDPDVIREEIERTRDELAGTVDALQAKLDVKSQAKARVARVKDRRPPASPGSRTRPPPTPASPDPRWSRVSSAQLSWSSA